MEVHLNFKNNADRAVTQAAREAGAAETRRCAAIATLCNNLGQFDQAIPMMLSEKPVSEIEAELKRIATAASWDAAIAKVDGQS